MTPQCIPLWALIASFDAVLIPTHPIHRWQRMACPHLSLVPAKYCHLWGSERPSFDWVFRTQGVHPLRQLASFFVEPKIFLDQWDPVALFCRLRFVEVLSFNGYFLQTVLIRKPSRPWHCGHLKYQRLLCFFGQGGMVMRVASTKAPD